MINEDNTKKCINIVGQSNRYQMKKLINENQSILKKRIDMIYLDKEYFSYVNQLSLLKNGENHIIIKQLEKKISGYKQQDNEKMLFDSNKFITLKNIVEELLNKEMKCTYCDCEMSVLYENVREPSQWTVDRINNDLGHNTDNYVLACLKCNIERKRTSKDKFMFTKQLKVFRKNY